MCISCVLIKCLYEMHGATIKILPAFFKVCHICLKMGRRMRCELSEVSLIRFHKAVWKVCGLCRKFVVLNSHNLTLSCVGTAGIWNCMTTFSVSLIHQFATKYVKHFMECFEKVQLCLCYGSVCLKIRIAQQLFVETSYLRVHPILWESL